LPLENDAGIVPEGLKTWLSREGQGRAGTMDVCRAISGLWGLYRPGRGTFSSTAMRIGPPRFLVENDLQPFTTFTHVICRSNRGQVPKGECLSRGRPMPDWLTVRPRPRWSSPEFRSGQGGKLRTVSRLSWAQAGLFFALEGGMRATSWASEYY